MMNVTLSPEEEKLINELRKTGGYPDVKAVLLAALKVLKQHHPTQERPRQLSQEEWVRRFDEFMAEVDRDPPSKAGPLSDDALSRETFYDTERTRV
jgi:Arc/MetJ-type ribon-helix-helix transcriptional regulator